MSEGLENIGNQKLPSILNDPFHKTNVKKVFVNFEDFWGDGKWKASGVVYFRNGKTNGQQEFNGETFDEVVAQIKTFIDELS